MCKNRFCLTLFVVFCTTFQSGLARSEVISKQQVLVWKSQALMDLSCRSGKKLEDMSPVEANRRITGKYAEKYLEDSKRNNWFGLAAIVSNTVGIAVAYSEFELKPKSNFGFGWYEDRRQELGRIVVGGGLESYLDIAWVMKALESYSIDDLFANNLIFYDQYIAFQKMHSQDWQEVYQGVKQFNRYQQKVVLQPIYDENQATAKQMTLTLYSPIKGQWYFPRGLFWAVQPFGSFGALDDRLLWGDKHVVDPWVYRSQNKPEKMHQIATRLAAKSDAVCKSKE